MLQNVTVSVPSFELGLCGTGVSPVFCGCGTGVPPVHAPARRRCHTIPHSSAQSGMALSETLIVAALMGVILVLGGLFVESTRNELKRRQVWAMLATLDKATSAYHETTQAWPAAERHPDDSADPIIALLQTQTASRDVLEEIPTVSRSPTKNNESWTVQDAWGHRLRCLTAGSRSVVDREAVVANGGKPIFISGNVNGEFRGEDGTAAADNLRSDELPR